MDPFTIALFALAGAMVSDQVSSLARLAAEGENVPLGSFYAKTAQGQMESPTPYPGRNVVWEGFEGRMFQADPAYMTSISGNIFYENKLRSVASAVHRASEADEPLVFVAPYGTVSKIGLQDVKESIEYASEGGQVLSTGDEDLDQFLVDPQEAMYAWTVEEDDEDAVYIEDLDLYLDPDGLEELGDFRRLLVEAERDGDGDLGAWQTNFRDGNHRAFGAVLGGEPFVWMILNNNDFQDVVKARALLAAGQPLRPYDAEALELGELLQ